MKIFRVSRKSALTFGDILLEFRPCLLEMHASHSFLFPSFCCCSFSCSRCGLLCTFCIQTTSTQLDSSLQNHLLKLWDGRGVFALCWASSNIYQDEIRIKLGAGKDYFWIIRAVFNCTFLKSRNICHNLLCGQLFCTFNSYYFSLWKKQQSSVPVEYHPFILNFSLYKKISHLQKRTKVPYYNHIFPFKYFF